MIKRNIVYASFIRIYRLLPRKFKRGGLFTLLGIFANSLLDILGLGAIIPIVLAIVEDGAIQNNKWLNHAYEFLGFTSENGFILAMCAALMVVLVLKNALSIYIIYYQSRFSYELQAYFSQNLFRAFYDRGLSYFKKMNSSNILRNVNSVPSSFAQGVILPMVSLFNELSIILFISIGLLIYNFQVVILLLLVVGPTFGLFYRFSKNRIKRYQEEVHHWSPKLTKVVFEAVFGFMDVKISGTEENFFNRHRDVQGKLVANWVKANTFKQAPVKVVEFSMFLGIVLIISYGIFAFETRKELVTLLGVFALAAYRVLPSVNRLMMAVMSIKSFEYTIEVMERKDAHRKVDTISGAELQMLGESIYVRDVAFNYEGSQEQILKNVNLEIKKGDVVGIIGESGSGKSTLMNLLLGFFAPRKGSIEVDGKVIDQSNVHNWQRSIGYVPQDVFLIDASIKENVAFGSEISEIDENKVWESLRLASLEPFVRSLPKNMDTVVGERGGNLSGGQKQRIGIARAIYNEAKVLFFDEATSALDTQTERDITESIQKLNSEDFTMVIVAHRITTLKYCTRIVEMKEGKVVSESSYEKLVEQHL